MENPRNFGIDERWEKKLDRDKVDKETFAKNMSIAEEDSPDSSRLEDFSYTFENGAVIKVHTSKDGVITMFVETKNTGVFNLNDFLPKGYIMVTKKYIEELWKNKPHYLSSLGNSNFACIPEDKLILVNKITDPKHLLAILHEIGHAIDDSNKFEFKLVLENTLKQDELAEKFPKFSNKISSKQERSANANALKLYRKIKQKFGVNLLEPFSSFKEVQEFIYTFLAHYRYSAEFEFQESKEREKWSDSKLSELLGRKDYSFLEKLYDKNKLARITNRSEK